MLIIKLTVFFFEIFRAKFIAPLQSCNDFEIQTLLNNKTSQHINDRHDLTLRSITFLLCGKYKSPKWLTRRML